MKKRLLVISIFFCLTTMVSGQQHSLYSQYLFNLYIVNPAYAGELDALATGLSYRTQWVGFEGAPTTQNFTVHSPLSNSKMALGLQVQNDEIGARGALSVLGTYSYKLRMGRRDHLSFGLSGGMVNYQYHWDELNYRQGLDPVAFGTDGNKWIANFDFGAMYITPKAYLGLSVLSVNNAKTISSEASDARLDAIYTAIAGKVFTLSKKVQLKPSTIIRKSAEGPLQFDLNMSAMYKNKFWVTTTYRYQYGAVLSAHFYLNDHFHFGYSYDLPLNNLLAEQSGTHEVFIGYNFSIYKSGKVSSRNF